jgi:hypothetical protein
MMPFGQTTGVPFSAHVCARTWMPLESTKVSPDRSKARRRELLLAASSADSLGCCGRIKLTADLQPHAGTVRLDSDRELSGCVLRGHLTTFASRCPGRLWEEAGDLGRVAALRMGTFLAGVDARGQERSPSR